jgi:Na+/phosphate symporter
MLFNLIGVLLFLPFIGMAEKILNKLLPDRRPEALSAVSVIALSTSGKK